MAFILILLPARPTYHVLQYFSRHRPQFGKACTDLGFGSMSHKIFSALDTDGSGTISKRELYTVLEKAGLANGKQALEVFAGFDQDQNGQLDFDEFKKIAKILM